MNKCEPNYGIASIHFTRSSVRHVLRAAARIYAYKLVIVAALHSGSWKHC